MMGARLVATLGEAGPICSRRRDERRGLAQIRLAQVHHGAGRRLRELFLCRGFAPGRGAAKARLAPARSSARLLDRRAPAVERPVAPLCRSGRQGGQLTRSCSRRRRINPQHATFLNVAYGSSFDGDDTQVSAVMFIPASRPGPRPWRWWSIAAHRGGRFCGLSPPATKPPSVSASRCSRAISSAASRAPAPATCSARPRLLAGC